MKIPFDNLTLLAILQEIKPFIGAKLQKIVQPSEHELYLSLYKKEEQGLFINIHPLYARLHLTSTKPVPTKVPLPFCNTLRSKLKNATLTQIEQVQFDRIAIFHFQSVNDTFKLIIEIMGKHSNMIFIHSKDKKILGAAKWIGLNKSKRPILPGKKYHFPPVLAQDPDSTQASPFLIRLLESAGKSISSEHIKKIFHPSNFSPTHAPNHGAYPISVAPLGLQEEKCSSLSAAIEQHFFSSEENARLLSLKNELLQKTETIKNSKKKALEQVKHSLEVANTASELQEIGELLLTHASQIPKESHLFHALNPKGQEININLNTKLSPIENANFYFEKAKKAKQRRPFIEGQFKALKAQLNLLESTEKIIQQALNLQELQNLKHQLISENLLHPPSPVIKRKEDRPFGGHAIRSHTSPQGWQILYGEKATANDYLTTKVAKPNDIWLHVRGSSSAHVLIQTHKQPEKVQQETLIYAAKIAVQHSSSKHARYIPVDYTLAKYVRKPKKSSPGAVTYSREKTLHIENES